MYMYIRNSCGEHVCNFADAMNTHYLCEQYKYHYQHNYTLQRAFACCIYHQNLNQKCRQNTASEGHICLFAICQFSFQEGESFIFFLLFFANPHIFFFITCTCKCRNRVYGLHFNRQLRLRPEQQIHLLLLFFFAGTLMGNVQISCISHPYLIDI